MSTGSKDDSTVFLPIKGYLDAGGNPERETSDLGTIGLPLHMVPGRRDDYFLLVDGDRLAPDGIHNGDLLLVCPDQAPGVGGLCVIDMDFRLHAATYRDPGNVLVRTATRTVINLEIAPEQIVGAVAFHVRKM